MDTIDGRLSHYTRKIIYIFSLVLKKNPFYEVKLDTLPGYLYFGTTFSHYLNHNSSDLCTPHFC